MGDNQNSTEESTADIQDAGFSGGEEPEQLGEGAVDLESESLQATTSGEDGDASTLQAEIASLNEQLQDAKDQTLRAAAEMQNLRKRAERDVENAHKFGQEKLINSLLPVLDNLDRALDSVDKDIAPDDQAAALKSLYEGVELTRKSALGALEHFSVEVLEPYGEPFDPQFHEAMTMVPSETAEPNSVIDVLQKGYSLKGRLLRAAMVVVAKP